MGRERAAATRGPDTFGSFGRRKSARRRFVSGALAGLGAFMMARRQNNERGSFLPAAHWRWYRTGDAGWAVFPRIEG
ncbi:MAG: hypothetical protein AAB295_11110, partial [Chloroflexota bacterium]